ncbi:sulfatase [Aquimarina aggregata]|uniref:Sulfatase n=1 Tax=Aquimarina aggregata TaxID=1642818 RepID=A0A162XAD4_9FLAO|nr:formylglycine-generating enzyme family protein [Aquimarina aggregata]KZS38515.1 sulfatase [Aquimarina aggregata]
MMKYKKTYILVLVCIGMLTSCNKNKERESSTDIIEKVEEKKLSYHEIYLKEILQLPKKKKSDIDTLSMIKVKGGIFLMGGISDQARRDEFPRHKEEVKDFWVDKTEVTNKQFREFVEQTGYVTTAEREIEIQGKVYDPGALVFDETNPKMWWKFETGANWKKPYGPNSTIEGKDNHPVVQVSWYDAMAYAFWAGKRLATEVEWEYAARGGRKDNIYFWGDDFKSATKYANFFQGNFPMSNNLEDSYVKTSSVGSFPENGFGLLDMAGNVWEWCLDTYYPDAYLQLDKREDGYFKKYYNQEQHKVVRGGSFLCSESYCTGYRAAARMSSTPDSGLEHTGFRCVKDVIK